jgi:hydroxyethylthiazole kinase
VLDVCGSACLPTRREYALGLIGTSLPSVIKGNYSEITALAREDYTSSGVDADKALTAESVAETAKSLAQRLGTVIIASGEADIITDGDKTAFVKNGCAQLGSVTGTGCMQGALCAAYLSASESFYAAAAACVVFGICGQLAQTDKGAGSFMVNLLDALSTVSDEQIAQLERIEIL